MTGEDSGYCGDGDDGGMSCEELGFVVVVVIG